MGSLNEFPAEVLPPDVAACSLTLHSPLEALFSQYSARRAELEHMASFAQENSGAIECFLNAARAEGRLGTLSVKTLFLLEPAVRVLDAQFWAQAMALTDVLEWMPAEKRREWQGQIYENATPPFDRSTVLETLRDLMARRSQFFAERVDGLFRSLSNEHVTNSPMGFGKRLIVGSILTHYSQSTHTTLNHRQLAHVHDLRVVIARFMGRDAPCESATNADVGRIHSAKAFGVWHTFDGGAFRIKIFLKGTAHLEVHPQLARNLNNVLAWLHPNAIAAAFRTPSPAARKERPLIEKLVAFQTLEELARCGLSSDGYTLTCYGANRILSAEAQAILASIGGVPDGSWTWRFDYPPASVLAEIQRTGCVPDKVSHQFFATAEVLAREVVDLAEIQDDDQVVEPSGGHGGIADFLPKEQLTVVEVSPLKCKILEAKGFAPICADFLKWRPATPPSKIVMNPPFSDGRALDHLRHAASILAPGGRIVAILPGSMNNKPYLPGFKHRWQGTREEMFADTGVSIAILVLDRLPEAR